VNAQMTALVEALQFYADDQKAVMVISPVPVHIDSDTGSFDYEPQVVDRGEVARAALDAIREG
jgi:predicted NBD/HSP70 family sugar kinase